MLKKYILLALGIISPLIIVGSVSAVDVINPGICERYYPGGDTSKPIADNAPTVCRENTGGSSNPIFGKNGILTSVINILSIIVSIVAIISIVFAGLKFVSSGNNPQEVSKSREIIIYACIGLGVAALSQVLVRFIINQFF